MDPFAPPLEHFGLAVWAGDVRAMRGAHRHVELELNLLTQGSVTYLFGGRRVRLEAGQLLIFWGALPHALTEYEPGTRCVWLTLPLPLFLRFGLPETFSGPLLHGDALLEPCPGETDDLRLLGRWLTHGPGGEEKKAGEEQKILELELEARLRRLALSLGRQPIPETPHETHTAPAAALAAFISEHDQHPLTLAGAARAVGLNPTYAAGLFKRTFGMTVLAYLTQHRLAHAQRLLATTDWGVLGVALEAGFRSSSRFYAVFTKACGETPGAYRKRVR